MNLDSMMLSEISQRESRLMITRDWGLGKWGDVDQRAQKLFIIKMNKFWI